MSKKISELKEATTVNDTDLLMIIQNGENKKIQASKIGTGQGGSGGGDTLPIGTIVPYGSDVIPDGWLRCDGSIVEQSDYPELFSVIGTTYGYYGRTDFKLPDLQGRVAVGKNTVVDTENPDTDFDELGKYGGKKEHTLTIDEMPSHTHKIQVRSGGIGDYYGDPPFTDANAGNLMDGGDTKSTGGSQPHNNLQPYLVTNYIIKAKMTVSIKGEIIQETGTASMDNVYSAVAVDNKLKTNIVTGEETATNEYIDGKQVFVKRIDIGNLPNAGRKIIDTEISRSAATIEKFEGKAEINNVIYMLPNLSLANSLAVLGDNSVGIFLQDQDETGYWKISVTSQSDRSDYTGYVNIYYTKN